MILCCGEALIDMLPVSVSEADGDAPPAWAAHPGGAVFNTALALGRLEVAAGLLSGLSRDGFGDMLRATLDRAGVDHGLSVTSDRKTTLAFVSLKDGQARYSFHDEGSALRLLDAADLPALPEAVEVLFFGGISLAAEPCGSAFEALQAREAGRRLVMFDPNIRPAFAADEAAYRARMARMIERTDIVKLSDEDLDWLYPDAGPLEARMRALLARGPRLVVVTLGSRGARAVARGGAAVAVPAPAVEVVDTVGAGDTFNAGLLARLGDLGCLDRVSLEALPEAVLREALAYGVAAAAVVVGRAGAEPPGRAALEALVG